MLIFRPSDWIDSARFCYYGSVIERYAQSGGCQVPRIAEVQARLDLRIRNTILRIRTITLGRTRPLRADAYANTTHGGLECCHDDR